MFGLTDHEKDLIVTFMLTLTDGFTTPYPNIDTFTGECATGGSAATQGNEFLIPTPELPPCAPEICGVEPVPGSGAHSIGQNAGRRRNADERARTWTEGVMRAPPRAA
jgi:hypothetical protein